MARSGIIKKQQPRLVFVWDTYKNGDKKCKKNLQKNKKTFFNYKKNKKVKKVCLHGTIGTMTGLFGNKA
jgi:hypothetical protein